MFADADAIHSQAQLLHNRPALITAGELVKEPVEGN
jgi:hypothetical protein